MGKNIQQEIDRINHLMKVEQRITGAGIVIATVALVWILLL